MDEIRITGLDPFTGDTSADDYLAIDNANGTKKISATALLANAKGENVISFSDPNNDGNIVITFL